MFCNVASWEIKSLSSGGTSTFLVAVSILNATNNEKLFRMNDITESGFEGARLSTDEGFVCHG